LLQHRKGTLNATPRGLPRLNDYNISNIESHTLLGDLPVSVTVEVKDGGRHYLKKLRRDFVT
jgi:hypothetical protein